MREHPIIFSMEMIKAILEGSKTQTRRVIKPQPIIKQFQTELKKCICQTYQWRSIAPFYCPYGKVGHRLWVRESWRVGSAEEKYGAINEIAYRAGGRKQIADEISENAIVGHRAYEQWQLSIHMPRWASRITLKITDIRVERLQDITVKDFEKEGLKYIPESEEENNMEAAGIILEEQFENLWNSIHKKQYRWEDNPWVWIINFIRLNTLC